MINKQIRSIAFYLPQYHPIPENDAWWGRGFTEWTNVSKAKPLFPGHYQPHMPADLGFYDLRLPEVRKAQAELAGEHGIYGFCYYHYWFNSKRLLNRPFDEVLSSGEPDFPFCICWANENWTRVWDGQEKNILIKQEYNANDDREHIRWLVKAFDDKRYIRVQDKPLFLVYRVSNIPDPRKTAEIWREEAQKAGIGDIYLATVESLQKDRVNPDKIGFDAAVEFQPDWLKLGRASQVIEGNNSIYDYAEIVKIMLHKKPPNYIRFPGVTTGWDNTSRRMQDAIILENSTPELYESWLKRVVENLQSNNVEEKLVFINAWNEWSEGAHLEPCQKWGLAYLEATKRALEKGNGISLGSNNHSHKVQNIKTPLSVCIPTYNGANFIGEAISSVLEQTVKDFQLIVVDDCSTDNTEKVVNSFRDSRLKFYKNPSRLGMVNNWNKCLELSKGQFINIFHQDDIMMPDNLLEKIEFLEDNPTVGMVYSNVYQLDSAGEVLSDCWYFKPKPEEHGLHKGIDFFKTLINGVNIVCCPSVVIRRDCYEKLGGFDEKLPFTTDLEMWLRIALFYDIGYLIKPLVKYRRHESMETNNFLGIKELQHSYQAKMLILEKYPERISDLNSLKVQVAQYYVGQASEQASQGYRQGEKYVADQYLAFAEEVDGAKTEYNSGKGHVDMIIRLII